MAKRFLLLFGICFAALTPVAHAQLDVSPPLAIDIFAPLGQTRVVPILVTGNPGTIDAYGLTLIYPTNLLTFVQTDTAGTATSGWTSSSGQENTPGEITIGGFDIGGGFTTQNDTLIKVVFMDDSVFGTDVITLSAFVNDIDTATTTAGTLNITLPVELSTFSAEVNANEVTLNWRTTSETNNFGFEIQKSFDEIEFTKIGFVQGHGTSSQPHNYSFADADLDRDRPVRYYRLKQIDLDGTFDFSGILTVELTTPEAFSLAQNYPNPFNPETTINYELPERAQVSIVLYNLLGQVVRTLVDQEMPGGFHSVIWNGKDDFGSEAPSGTYIYKMRTADYSTVRKLTLLR